MLLFVFFPFIFISWRLITLQYCSGFCHTLTWISHGGPVFKEVDYIAIIFNQERLRPGLCVSTRLPNMAFDSSQTQTFKKILFYRDIVNLGFPGGSCGKELACQCRRLKEMWVWSLGREDPLEEGMATHSSILAWRIPMDRGGWRATVHT